MSSEKIPIDRDGVENILEALLLLKQRNCAETAENMWLGASSVESIEMKVEDWTRATVLNSSSDLRNLRQTLGVLNEITESLSSLVSRFESTTRTAALHVGINSLPNELLAYIIELACEPYRTKHVRFASINRRLREAALSNPRLWSYVSTCHSVEFTELQIARCGASGLSVRIGLWEDWGLAECAASIKCSCASVVKTLIQHTDNWRELELMGSHSRSNWVSDVTIRDCLTGIRLPALTHLKLGPSSLESTFKTLPATWEMPRLQHLACPPDLEGFTDAKMPPIRSFHANFMWLQKNMLFSTTTRVFTMMKTFSQDDMSLIEDLTITFPSRLEVNGTSDASHLIHLPRLRSLKLGRFMSPGVTQCVIDHVLSRLDMPLLEELSFGLDNFWEVDSKDLLILQWFQSKKFEALKKVFVDVCENVKPGKMSRDRFNALIHKAFTKPHFECSSPDTSSSSTTPSIKPPLQISIKITQVNPDSRPISFRNANEGKSPRSRFDREYDSDWRMRGGYASGFFGGGGGVSCECDTCGWYDNSDDMSHMMFDEELEYELENMEAEYEEDEDEDEGDEDEEDEDDEISEDEAEEEKLDRLRVDQ